MFDRATYAQMPFAFWTTIFFVFGCIVGSFLNVCIHRMPRGESIIRPPSHCPRCNYSIPWFLNVPLVTWLWLRGRCAQCGEPISPRYFMVELLTGIVFASCWIVAGKMSALVALAYCLFFGGLIAATFIDLEHLIIPDEITIGGMVAGFVCSMLSPGSHWDVMRRHFMSQPLPAMRDSLLGMGIGAGVVYAIVRLGKLLFGRYKINLPPGSKIYFGESSVTLPEEELPYEEVFYRRSDTIVFRASRLELVDRCYCDVQVRLQPHRLQIGSESMEPDKAPFMEAVTGEMIMPREAMGLGDVKFMGAIGAFLGWPATIFSLALSAIIGLAVTLLLVLAGKRHWSGRLPYGPYIALAAGIWVFGGYKWFMRLLE
ncbi:MAG TPA: prepilin peptidase [Verrucomicrobiae bacterium]|jgi:leader peptidase (prepilin peptidase)/N-methyltransferase|nr:prepilin peptidase [Verrucomicrobiae bacterium]